MFSPSPECKERGYFLQDDRVCANADAAADLAEADALGLRSVLLAFVATLQDVCLLFAMLKPHLGTVNRVHFFSLCHLQLMFVHVMKY